MIFLEDIENIMNKRNIKTYLYDFVDEVYKIKKKMKYFSKYY